VIGLLRQAGLDPTAEELADVLWLARWAKPAGRPEVPPSPGAEGSGEGGTGGPAAGPGQHDAAAEEREGPGGPRAGQTGDGEDPERVGIHAIGREHQRPALSGLPVRIPAAPILPAALDLQRALRPLQRFRPRAPAVRRTLDEAATAERSARAGMLLPVFRAVERRETSIELLVDASPSMAVWDRMLDEVRQVCERLGAFRDVQVHRLHDGRDGPPLIGAGPRGRELLRPADQLRDPTGRRLTVLISDCVGPLWRSGQAHRLLHRWGRQAPVAVLQPLPQRLWARTRLPVEPGMLFRDENRGSRLRFVSARRDASWEGGGLDPAAEGALPVPVLPPNAAALGAWAGLLSGTGSAAAPGAVGWVRADQQPAPASCGRSADRSSAPPPREVVRRFRATSSPTAVRLAVYLAAAPLTLPVMQLVQRTMLPGSGPVDMAEVLFSGMLVRLDDPAADDGEQWFDFVDGVRAVLLGPLAKDEALLVLKHCSEYVVQRFGTGARNFPAVAAAQLAGTLGPGSEPSVVLDAALPGAGTGEPPDRTPRPFAEVPYQVLRRYLPSPVPPRPPESDDPALLRRRHGEAVRRASVLLWRYEREGAAQHLLDAAGLLRHAGESAAEPNSEAEVVLAEVLLRLWRLQGDPGVLREAQRIAAAAAGRNEATARAHRVFGQVLHATARERIAAGDGAAGRQLLNGAERELWAVCAWPGLYGQDRLEPMLERSRVLWDLWRLTGNRGFLRRAVDDLGVFTADRDPAEPRSAALHLQLGRARLALAGATEGRASARDLAVGAVSALETALELMTAEPTETALRARALMDLADAVLLAGDGGFDTALRALELARSTTRGTDAHAECLTRIARVHRERHKDSGDPADLEQATETYAAARRLLSTGDRAYVDVLIAWGEAALARARLPERRPGASPAVRALREARAEMVARDPRMSRCLLLLGQALLQRYADERDAVDLREGELILARAASAAREPMQEAEAWYEHGRAARMLSAAGHLERAAASYESAARAALRAREAAPPGPAGDSAVRLAARAAHRRGEALEADGRPLTARGAYELALRWWNGLPDSGGDEAAATRERLQQLSQLR
jgi:tetratricopeptide (TPR) repeat protein